jgi:hypothetical protein
MSFARSSGERRGGRGAPVLGGLLDLDAVQDDLVRVEARARDADPFEGGSRETRRRSSAS